jgi:hypothetical protein
LRDHGIGMLWRVHARFRRDPQRRLLSACSCAVGQMEEVAKLALEAEIVEHEADALRWLRRAHGPNLGQIGFLSSTWLDLSD